MWAREILPGLWEQAFQAPVLPIARLLEDKASAYDCREEVCLVLENLGTLALVALLHLSAVLGGSSF